MQLRHIPRDASRFVRRAILGPPLPEALAPIIDCLGPGDTFVDIGANLGVFSARAAGKVGPTGRVLAVEANPHLASKLAAALPPHAAIESVAIGAKQGTAELYLFKQHLHSSLLRDGRAGGRTQGPQNWAGSVRVPVEPLAGVLRRHKIAAVHALKIDIEGYEDRALLPFFEAAPRALWPRHVMIERSPHVWEQDCIARMQLGGYRVVWEGRGDTMLSL